MTTEAITDLFISALSSFGLAMLAILAAIAILIVGYLVFTRGMYALLHDRSLSIGGFYLRDTPWKGYHRFRSRSWNMAHMP